MRALGCAVAVAAAVALSGCTATAPAVEPIAVDAADAQGQTLTVEVDQLLYIDTGDLGADVESFTARIDDESVVEFVPGREAGDFAMYPGFEPLSVGSTRVTLSAEDEGISPIEFTVQVTQD